MATLPLPRLSRSGRRVKTEARRARHTTGAGARFSLAEAAPHRGDKVAAGKCFLCLFGNVIGEPLVKLCGQFSSMQALRQGTQRGVSAIDCAYALSLTYRPIHSFDWLEGRRHQPDERLPTRKATDLGHPTTTGTWHPQSAPGPSAESALLVVEICLAARHGAVARAIRSDSLAGRYRVMPALLFSPSTPSDPKRQLPHR